MAKAAAPSRETDETQGTLLKDVVTHSITSSRAESETFVSQCTEEKRHLFEAHRRTVMRSVRRWEQRQLREKTVARANRLAQIRSENHERLVDLQNGTLTYNLKSIRQVAVEGDIGRLVELLNLGFDADSSSAMGLTPLLGACQSGRLKAVRILLRSGADVDHQHIKTKRTALMEASARENADVVQELLRHGARLQVQDARGETAFDCAKDPLVRSFLNLAASIWSQESAKFFPIPFRNAGRTLLLIQKRQQMQDVERRTAMWRELSTIRPTILRSAAEAKMRYDEQVRHSQAQVTLLQKVDVLRRADEQFDEDRAQLVRIVERAVVSKAEGEQPRTLTSLSISMILAFCDRHWFDPNAKNGKQRRRRGHTTSDPRQPISARGGLRLHVVPEAIKAEWSEMQCALESRCEQLRRVQTEERPDTENGVTRNTVGHTLSALHVCVLEAQHLPYCDPRVQEQIDPFVRLTLRDRVANCASSSTDVRIGDRHPTWSSDFSFGVESTKADLLIQLMDAKRSEVAGEATVALRTLVDQKQHDDWLVLPPTLRQQALEKTPREHAARVRLTLRLIHTPSILLAREIQQLLTTRTDLLRRKFALMQSALEENLQKLTKVGS